VWLPAAWRRLPLPTYPFQRRSFRVVPGDAPIVAAPLPGPGALQATLAAAAPEARVALLAQHVQARCAAVLRLLPHEVDVDEPLADHGFDSLRAAELAAQLERDAGVALPFVELVDGATARDVAAAIARRWHTAHAADAARATDLLRAVAAMPPDEVARRLREVRGDG
jgi:aryl carrier-like protein